MINSNFNKTGKISFEFLLIFLLLTFPKIDLIDFPKVWQGIRIDDLIILYLAFFLVFSKTLIINRNDVGYYFIIYFFVLLISMIHGSIYFKQTWLVLPRYIEYLVLIIYFNRHNPSIDSIFLIIRSYLTINFIVVLLQLLGLVGEFNSVGYQSVENLTDDRPNGLTGGPWEIANISAILFYCLLLDKKQSIYKKYSFSLIIFFLIIITSSRTTMVSLSASMLVYYYLKNMKVEKFLIFCIFFVIFLSLILYIFFIFNLTERIDKTYFEVPNLFFNWVITGITPYVGALDNRLWSFVFRLDHWGIFYDQFLTNMYTICFGTGSTFIYYESTLFRILFGTGLFGFIFVVYGIRKIPIHILTLLFISGLTLDLILSFKIFTSILLYFYLNKKLEIR